jgi:hypothetical protein
MYARVVTAILVAAIRARYRAEPWFAQIKGEFTGDVLASDADGYFRLLADGVKQTRRPPDGRAVTP